MRLNIKKAHISEVEGKSPLGFEKKMLNKNVKSVAQNKISCLQVPIN